MAGSERLEILRSLCLKVKAANYPEQIFGKLSGSTVEEQKRDLQKQYHGFIRVCHPDRNREDKQAEALATEITKMINAFYSEAVKKIEQGIYGFTVKPSSGRTAYARGSREEMNAWLEELRREAERFRRQTEAYLKEEQLRRKREEAFQRRFIKFVCISLIIAFACLVISLVVRPAKKSAPAKAKPTVSFVAGRSGAAVPSQDRHNK